MSIQNIKPFPLDLIRNNDAYCVNAFEKDVTYLLAFEPDRLLAGFRETAGLDLRGAKRYEGWETTLIGGHTIGHYLSALSQAYVNPQMIGMKANDGSDAKSKAYEIMTTLIDGLLECQRHSKGKENFLFGAVIVDPENVEKQFDNIEKDLTNIITQAWVPWYTMHKILAGVLDTYHLTGYANALTLAEGIGDWTYNRAMGWDEETAAQVIRVEYGGMNEVLYDLYEITSKEKYAVAAHFFDSVQLYERIAVQGENALNNHHANTTIPKFIGALKRYTSCHGKVIGGEKIDASRYLEYAMIFWDTVVDKHTYVTGGNSEWEHFGRDNILDAERTNCNCETCNIYNMLKYSRTLFCLTGDVKYMDYYERGFYNTILSSQNPETGMTTYFQPMSTGYFKVFGQRFDKFWCCTGTGMENFTKLGDTIFFGSDTHLLVNLYFDSEMNWKEKNLTVSVKANLQKSDLAELRIRTMDGNAAEVGIALRLPAWLAAPTEISIAGAQVPYEVKNGYALLPAGLPNGTVITLRLPMALKAFALPDNDRSIAFVYGPTVLSADLGCEDMTTTTTGMMVTIPATRIGGFDDIVLPDGLTPDEFIDNPGKYFEMGQNAEGMIAATLTLNGLHFAPHFARYRERYGIYFVVRTKEELEAARAARQAALLDKPEGIVIDTVQPGYGQYENDELHRMFDWGGSVGSTEHGTSRYAKAGGSFTYHMCVSEELDNYLSLTFLAEDNGKSLRISSGDIVFYEDTLDYEGDEESYEIRVKIPAEAARGAQTVQANGEEHSVIPLTFKGSEGAQSARLFGFVYVMNY